MYKEITARFEIFDHAHLILRPVFELENDRTSKQLKLTVNVERCRHTARFRRLAIGLYFEVSCS